MLFQSNFTKGLRGSALVGAMMGLLSLRHAVLTGSGAQSASYPMGTGDTYRGINGRGVKLTTNLRLVSMTRICGAMPTLPHTSSWRGSWLSTGTTLPFTPYVNMFIKARYCNLDRIKMSYYRHQ